MAGVDRFWGVVTHPKTRSKTSRSSSQFVYPSLKRKDLQRRPNLQKKLIRSGIEREGESDRKISRKCYHSFSLSLHICNAKTFYSNLLSTINDSKKRILFGISSALVKTAGPSFKIWFKGDNFWHFRGKIHRSTKTSFPSHGKKLSRR